MNEEYIEIVASIGQPAEIISEITGEAHIDAVVDASTTEFVAEIVAAGPRGPQGEQGIQGPEGPPGRDGADGADGQDGADGADGVSPEVTIASITGGHSVTITDADHPGGQTFNVMDGQDGNDGAAATIAVGTVTTGAPNDPASVTNTGTSTAAVFDFTIPKGDKGDTGSTGPTGPGVPDGGAAATILRKASGTDQDTEWYPPYIPYGQLDNTSTSTVMTATVPGVTKLEDGVCIMLKNGVVTSASGVTLNINGLGAKPIYSSMAATTAITTVFNVNYTMLFVYDTTRVAGGCWVVYYGYNANDNTIGYQLRTNSSGLPMSDKVYRYRICFTSADGTKWVPATTSTSTNATSARTVNQRPIDPFGKIIYYSYTTAIDAGSRLGTGYQWTQYALVLGYSFNVAGNETVTAWKPCYLKCAPQNDGSAIMDSTTPIVQALPSTEDGKIYIFLGIAYDTTHMELCHDHPVYYYKGGAIRAWTNAASGGGGGAVDSVNGYTGTVVLDADDVGAIEAPATPATGDILVYDGADWASTSERLTILSYGSSTWTDFINAYDAKRVVYCRASSNNDPGSGSQNRLAFMAYVNNAATPTEVEFQYYRSVATHSDSQQGDQVFVYKLTSSGGGTWSVTTREAYTKIAAGTGLSSAYSSGTLTLSNSQTVPSAATAAPEDLGTAAVGTSTKYAREDHVHDMPSASDVGAVATSALLDLVYPVGSLYWSSQSTDPGTLFGGTWAPVKDTFILAAGDTYTAGSTGGAATHTLTVSEMPSHNHGNKTLTGTTPVRNANSDGSAGIVGTGSGIIDSSGHYSSKWSSPVQLISSGTSNYPKTLVVNASHTHDSNGGGAAHNNMPPYKVYYCWERTA